jgi:hypothetical protein
MNHSSIVLSFAPSSSAWSFPFRFSDQQFVRISQFSYVRIRLAHLFLLDFMKNDSEIKWSLPCRYLTTGWTTEVQFPGGAMMGFSLLAAASRLFLGPTQPCIQRLPGAVSPFVKQPGREADHSPPSSAEVKNVWSYTSTPQHVFMAWCLVKHRNYFILTLWSAEDTNLHLPCFVIF